MKTSVMYRILGFITLSVAMTGLGLASRPAATVALFDGRTLDGWTHVLADSAVPREQVWSVRDGLLVCAGTPLGVLYTEKNYTNFQLVVEYRWAPGGKPGNSGIMSRIKPGTGALPQTVEVQLQHGNAGDVLGLKGFAIAGGQPRWFERESAAVGRINGVKKSAGAEKPPGEWNRVELEARGDHYTVRLNGQLVNDVSGVTVVPGRIGLQSEGGEIHFRGVMLTPLPDESPSEAS
ncbi:MAG: DUF1080 domain-containing protein [Opitutaceae bacterium]|nr:DUF1080 domain-containing protein [Opitutaceae bacterium]